MQKNIFTFGTAKIKCQQQAQVFQLILINWNPIKMLKKVWFEKAWELTFQSHLKLVSLVKKSMKSCFFSIYLKKCLHIRSNFSNFLLTKTIDKNKFWFSQNLGKILGKFRFDSQFSPVYHEITATSPFSCRVGGGHESSMGLSTSHYSWWKPLWNEPLNRKPWWSETSNCPMIALKVLWHLWTS